MYRLPSGAAISASAQASGPVTPIGSSTQPLCIPLRFQVPGPHRQPNRKLPVDVITGSPPRPAIVCSAAPGSSSPAIAARISTSSSDSVGPVVESSPPSELAPLVVVGAPVSVATPVVPVSPVPPEPSPPPLVGAPDSLANDAGPGPLASLPSSLPPEPAVHADSSTSSEENTDPW